MNTGLWGSFMQGLVVGEYDACVRDGNPHAPPT